MTAKLDKSKYLDLAREQGISAALTQLHRDMAIVEYQAFEGDRRAEPELLNQLNAMRDFSREIWEIDLRRKT
ncbi:MAG TPA: hypothetical protein VM598_04950 [Bdellovibrionota bacterium]|jgi:hypothetical protein|nr:hypothetical protein [Bdellovibrionota bacterium]